MALDVGSRRIGVALANHATRLAGPLATLERSSSTLRDIEQLVHEHVVTDLVVGLPRSLEGQITQQTRDTLTFIKELQSQLTIPVHQQDEALTSRQAESELIERGKPYVKGDIDALAATYILEDFLKEHQVAING